MSHDINEPPGFETDIKPLFRDNDRQSMRMHFDLWSRRGQPTYRSHLRPPPRRNHAMRRLLAPGADRPLPTLGRMRKAAMNAERVRKRHDPSAPLLDGPDDDRRLHR